MHLCDKSGKVSHGPATKSELFMKRNGLVSRNFNLLTELET